MFDWVKKLLGSNSGYSSLPVRTVRDFCETAYAHGFVRGFEAGFGEATGGKHPSDTDARAAIFESKRGAARAVTGIRGGGLLSLPRARELYEETLVRGYTDGFLAGWSRPRIGIVGEAEARIVRRRVAKEASRIVSVEADRVFKQVEEEVRRTSGGGARSAPAMAKVGREAYVAYPDSVERVRIVEIGTGDRNLKRTPKNPVVVRVVGGGDADEFCMSANDLFDSALAASARSAELAAEIDD